MLDQGCAATETIHACNYFVSVCVVRRDGKWIVYDNT